MTNQTTYLENNIAERAQWMLDLEEYARNKRVPIMEPVSMNFLTQLIRIYQPKNILEIGTAIGYSALRMHEAHTDSFITSIEKSKEMCHTAKVNIAQQLKTDKIEVIHADALEYMEILIANEAKFDFIFIDAAKAQYKRFFLLAEKLLNRDGIIVCDNILFRGYVANPEKAEHPRLQKLAIKINAFNEWLMQQENYHSSIVPIGDGLTISIKKT